MKIMPMVVFEPQDPSVEKLRQSIDAVGIRPAELKDDPHVDPAIAEIARMARVISGGGPYPADAFRDRLLELTDIAAKKEEQAHTATCPFSETPMNPHAEENWRFGQIKQYKVAGSEFRDLLEVLDEVRAGAQDDMAPHIG